MADTLRLAGGNKNIDLYPWLGAKARGHEALAGILGFGLPGTDNQWFEGAGSSRYRSSRVQRRTITIPLEVYAANRQDLNAQLSDLSIALDPEAFGLGSYNMARLYFGMPDDMEWYVDLVRSGGGDWSRKEDSDDRTYFRTSITFEGDSYWTRDKTEGFLVTRDPTAQTLLPLFAEQRVSSSTAFGAREVINIGDTYAWPTVLVTGPTTELQLIGPNSEELLWRGNLLAGQTLNIDMRENTIVDGAGVNRYDGLDAAPEFWAIAPGRSQISVAAANSTASTRVLVEWRPRRWAVA